MSRFNANDQGSSVPTAFDTDNSFAAGTGDAISFDEHPVFANAQGYEEDNYAMALIRAGAPWEAIYTALSAQGESVAQLAALLQVYQCGSEERSVPATVC